MATSQKLLTVEQFYALAAGRDTRAELVRGEVQEASPFGELQGATAAALVEFLRAFVRKNRLGRVLIEAGFILRRNPDVVRAPDVAFIHRNHLPPGGRRRSFIEGAPDIAIEVVSPNDTAQEMAEKTYEYQLAGTQEVWFLYSDLRRMAIHRRGSEPRSYTTDDTLEGGDLLPGFSLKVGDLFEEL